jgi:signal transduction histidine kinase
MQGARKPENEAQRIAELMRLDVLDSQDEEAFDELTELASIICGTPISLISLIDQDRQWFKSRVGLDARETPRELAFCAHAILQPDVFEVPNALEDDRFADNPLVSDDPNIRFYAGAPLVTEKGLPIGTLCVIGKEPRHLTKDQKRALQLLAKQVVGQLELRLNYKKLKRAEKEREKIFSVIGHDLRSPFNGVLGLSRILNQKADTMDREKIQSIAGNILSSSLQVFQVIDELMQWTKQRLGRTHSQPEPSDLTRMINETIKLLDDSLELKELNCQVQAGDNIQVLADTAIVKTILRNLIANAIKYSSVGGTIKVSVKVDGKQATISVEDEGSGVSVDVISQLFKETVESQSDVQGLKGSGIGLSLCAELIATQNGAIWIDESYTQGARIEFSLPLVVPS